MLDWDSGFHLVPFVAHFLHAQIMENCTTGSVWSFLKGLRGNMENNTSRILCDPSFLSHIPRCKCFMSSIQFLGRSGTSPSPSHKELSSRPCSTTPPCWGTLNPTGRLGSAFQVGGEDPAAGNSRALLHLTGHRISPKYLVLFSILGREGCLWEMDTAEVTPALLALPQPRDKCFLLFTSQTLDNIYSTALNALVKMFPHIHCLPKSK